MDDFTDDVILDVSFVASSFGRPQLAVIFIYVTWLLLTWFTFTCVVPMLLIHTSAAPAAPTG